MVLSKMRRMGRNAAKQRLLSENIGRYYTQNDSNKYYPCFLPAAKRHGQGKLWVGIVVLLLHQTIVSLVPITFMLAMYSEILG